MVAGDSGAGATPSGAGVTALTLPQNSTPAKGRRFDYREIALKIGRRLATERPCGARLKIELKAIGPRIQRKNVSRGQKFPKNRGSGRYIRKTRQIWEIGAIG